MNEIDINVLRKFLFNETDKQTSEIIKNWMNENDLSIDDLKKLIDFPEGIKVFDQIDTESDWAIVRSKIFKQPKQISLQFIARIAASIIVLLGLAGLAYLVVHEDVEPISIFNDNENVMIVSLPDSTQVYLHKNAKLTFFSNYDKRRTTIIDGLAFFEVKRNVHKPFLIHARQTNVRVLGTSFSVNCQSKQTEVIVRTGKVGFYSANKASDTLFLTKGNRGLYTANNQLLTKDENKNINYLAWKTHVLKFSNTPLTKVICDLEQYFGVKISVDNSLAKDIAYTSEFNNPSLDKILKEMELVLDIKYSKTKNLIKIYN